MEKYLYLRWSSLEQGKGSTLARQEGACRAYCESRGWTDYQIMKDEGRSAYTGANLTNGELGRFTERLETGLIPADSILIVEQLDRLSRRPAQEVLEWIFKVARLGLTIITVGDRLEINQAELERNQIGIITIVMHAFRAYNESRHKSERVGEAHVIRRQRLADGQTVKRSAQAPAWLTLDKDANAYAPRADRVAILKRIFDLAESGMGKERIAATFHDEGIPTWAEYANDDPAGRWKKGDKRAAKWQPSYIQKILTNAAVLGEYQPHRKGRADTKRMPVGEPISDYYPAVIDAAQFARVNSRKRPSPGRKGELVNLFSGLVRCGVCGERGIYRAKDNGKDESYLVCGNHKSVARCSNKHHIRYRPLRDAVLDAILDRALDDNFFTQPADVGRAEQALAAKRRERDQLQLKASRYLDAMGEDDDPDIKDRWRAARDDVRRADELMKKLEDEVVQARGAVSPAEHLARVNNVRAAIDDADPEVRSSARSRVMDALAQTVSQVCLLPNRRVQVIILNGAHALEFDDRGNLVREAGVLKQIADGDEQMLRGVTVASTGHPDEQHHIANNVRAAHRIIGKSKR